MYKYLLIFALLISCVSRPVPKKPQEEICPTIYDPHLCVITINSATFAGFGLNKCLALKKLKQTLIEQNHNSLLAQRAECGRVHK